MVRRQFSDEDGLSWEAFAADAVVAHGKPGAILAFRGQDGSEEEEALRSTITFNSAEAAHSAIATMSEKELRRRLDLARIAVGRA